MNGTVTNDKTAIDPDATRGGHTPIVYHIIFPQDLERYGYAKALCGVMMRRRDRPAIGRPQHRVVPEKLRTLDRGRPWRDSQFASTRLSPSRDMSR